MISVSARGVEKAARAHQEAARTLVTQTERSVAQASLLLRRELTQQFSGRGGRNAFLGKLGAAPPMLGVRSGAARDHLSPGGRVFRSGLTVTSSVGSPDKYVKAQEDGATIKGSPMLRIPLAVMQKPGGEDRFAGQTLTKTPYTFIFKSKKGNLFIAGRVVSRTSSGRRKASKISKGGIQIGTGLQLLYLLKPSITLRPRRMFSTVTERIRGQVTELIGRGVKIAVQRGNGG